LIPIFIEASAIPIILSNIYNSYIVKN